MSQEVAKPHRFAKRTAHYQLCSYNAVMMHGGKRNLRREQKRVAALPVPGRPNGEK